MTYAWLVAGLPDEGRAKIDGILRGPEPEDPKKVAAENAQAFGRLGAIQAQGRR